MDKQTTQIVKNLNKSNNQTKWCCDFCGCEPEELCSFGFTIMFGFKDGGQYCPEHFDILCKYYGLDDVE